MRELIAICLAAGMFVIIDDYIWRFVEAGMAFWSRPTRDREKVHTEGNILVDIILLGLRLCITVPLVCGFLWLLLCIATP